MEFRSRESGEVRWLTSPLLESADGPAHAFGVRRAPKAPPPEPEELLVALEQPSARALPLRQRHGTTVVVADSDEGFPRDADAVLSGTPGLAPLVSTADCLPVLLWDPASGMVGAVHAGWRGLASGILEAAVERLADAGRGAPARFVAAVGPSIGPCCYEVGEEVSRRFEDDLLRPGFGDRSHLDLWEGASRRLRASGIPDARTGCARLCTACNPDRLVSFRRQGSAAGRLVSLILPTSRG